jgi:metal-dependent amidase/aminoacylase/carboxypeptidase family protein
MSTISGILYNRLDRPANFPYLECDSTYEYFEKTIKPTLTSSVEDTQKEIEYRSNLKEKGIIKYFGGKPEFLSRGYFDGVDMALMIHTTTNDIPVVSPGSIGCIAKCIIYKGKAAHAGGSPWDGNNALYAATCGINACNALRETFQEKDIIRFHPIITNGGSMVNAIPETAILESYVRGKTFDAIKQSNKRLNQALIGAALSLGNNVEIIDSPGYAPHVNDLNMTELCKEAYKKAFPNAELKIRKYFNSGSTDMGDLSCVMPVVHPYAAGAQGTSHGKDYYIVDAEKACVDSAKWQVAMLYLLLQNGAERAKNIIANYKPLFNSKEEYFAYCDSFLVKGDRIEYSDSKIEIKI